MTGVRLDAGRVLRKGSRHREGGQGQRPKGGGFDRSSSSSSINNIVDITASSIANNLDTQTTPTKDVVKRYESASLDRNRNCSHLTSRTFRSSSSPHQIQTSLSLHNHHHHKQRSHRHRYVEFTATTTSYGEHVRLPRFQLWGCTPGEPYASIRFLDVSRLRNVDRRCLKGICIPPSRPRHPT
jgi:hypothetical protein